MSRPLQAAMHRVLHLGKAAGKPGEVYYPLRLKQTKTPTPKQNEVLVQLKAAALNHRDLFVRHHQYPAISLENPMLSDGYGVIVELGKGVSDQSLSRNKCPFNTHARLDFRPSWP
ncbi:hypothetical protein NXS19_008134 [Fusarium pseudograminearum]|nr:hypothetical protein NXS19_008134 [Fusarium pseudograminearum]